MFFDRFRAVRQGFMMYPFKACVLLIKQPPLINAPVCCPARFRLLPRIILFYTVLLGTTTYEFVLHRTNLYYRVLGYITPYYFALQRAILCTPPYYVLLRELFFAIRYHFVLQRTSLHFAVLLCTTAY